MIRAVLLLTLCSLVAAESAKDLIFRAKHAETVQGDLERAATLYEQALQSRPDAALQAEAHFRLSLCLEQMGEFKKALGHLGESIYAPDAVPARLRQRAKRAHSRLSDKTRKLEPGRPAPVAVDPTVQLRKTVREHLVKARRFMDQGDTAAAYYRVQLALALAPDDKEALALAADLETRMGDATAFVRDALGILKTWTEARTKVVASKARELLRQALRHGRKGEFAFAELRFKDSVEVIDACEFALDSDELIELRKRIEVAWRTLRRKHLRPQDANPKIERRPPGVGLRVDFLKNLQRMLDVVSAGGMEYRILPVTVRPRPYRRKPYLKPARFLMNRDRPSAWTAALFAVQFVKLRVEPESWKEPGNLLSASGSMLFVRNRPEILDAVQKAVRRIENPAPGHLRVRFLLVSIRKSALSQMRREFGPFELDGESGPLYKIVQLTQDRAFAWFRSYLKELSGDKGLEEHVFRVDLENGVRQTLFINEHLRNAAGYEDPSQIVRWARRERFGLLLDAYPLRDKTGRTATGLRITARIAETPTRIEETLGTRHVAKLYPRFSSQTTELFVDLPPRSLLLVPGLVDPFAAARGARDPDRMFLLVWENPAGENGEPAKVAGAGNVDAEDEGAVVEIPLGYLLAKVHDDPGPLRTPDRGFAERGAEAVLRDRAKFLESLFRAQLSDEIRIDPSEGTCAVPQTLRGGAMKLIADLEKESRRSYVVRIRARAVRTRFFERWMARENLTWKPFGNAILARTKATSGEFLLRNLPAEKGDVFAPEEEMAGFAVLGLQARHALSGRIRSSPSYSVEEDLATARTRKVTEGLRVTVRPYSRGGRIYAFIEIETAALESEVEEPAAPALSYAVQTRGVRVGGIIEMGASDRPSTAVIARIPHPTETALERLTEIVVAVTIRPAE
ncbi:MAG: tetratricopeptide repeat protein [Planctomycetota bacterium]|nr:tetratricopeptide repeat protein [Planctomycetota bacterium]